MTAIPNVCSWPIWQYFALSPSVPASSGTVFELAQYFAILALLVAVFSNADFRFRYRMALSKLSIRKSGFILSFVIGLALLLIDIWYENRLPVPRVLANENNAKAVVGFVFIVFVFLVIRAVMIGPTRFTRGNSQRFASVNFQFIHQGNAERLVIIAEELQESLAEIVKQAGRLTGPATPRRAGDAREDANALLLLFADARFCKVVVEKMPAFALRLISELQKYPDRRLPIYQFARNIGQEFILNTNSAFYQEDSGFYTGYFGYTRPITKIIFGNFDFIEQCAADGASPLEIGFSSIDGLDRQQMGGFLRASLAFTEAYMAATKGQGQPHSYAFARLRHSYESALSGIHILDGLDRYYDRLEARRLGMVADFIKATISLLEKHAVRPKTLRVKEVLARDAFDDIADLLFEAIFAASLVAHPISTAWGIQHNTVWTVIANLREGWAIDVVAHKLRRMLFDEISQMDSFGNFKSARILGYCLNVLGLRLVNRQSGFRREWYPLQAVVLAWTKRNYRRLLENHPKVAEACLMGSLTYDADNHRLSKTFSNDTGKEPAREYLDLD